MVKNAFPDRHITMAWNRLIRNVGVGLHKKKNECDFKQVSSITYQVLTGGHVMRLCAEDHRNLKLIWVPGLYTVVYITNHFSSTCNSGQNSYIIISVLKLVTIPRKHFDQL